MPEITVTVANKIATADKARYVCGNSDYVIQFQFDEEWDAYDIKTARFSYNRTYADVIFDGNECEIPVISDTYCFYVGVFAGDLHTTTPARIACKKSILCGGGVPADPPPDVYSQIMAMLSASDAGVHTTLTRHGNEVRVHYHNLDPKRTYKLHLYTRSRHNGRKTGSWYHPDNYDKEDGRRIGYGTLAGKTAYQDKEAVGVYDDVPYWMGKNGFLETEWPVNNDKPIQKIEIDYWMQTMLKPNTIDGNDFYTWPDLKPDHRYDDRLYVNASILGISQGVVAGLQFQFCLVDDSGVVYPCKNTLTIGCLNDETKEVQFTQHDGYPRVINLYRSVK